jgi:hypothetical protein
MSDAPRDDTRGRPLTPAEGAREALQQAARHARAAAAEAALALRSLLDAAAFFAAGAPARENGVLRDAAQWLDGVARGVAPEGGGDAALAQALAGALDAEIARWEARAVQDPEARAVLRAFLGVRELLWELGVRAAPPSSAPPREPYPPERPATRRRRVERVRVQG